MFSQVAMALPFRDDFRDRIGIVDTSTEIIFGD